MIVIVTLITLLPSYFICFANEEQTFDYESLTFTYIASLMSGDGALVFGLGFSGLVSMHAFVAILFLQTGTFSYVFKLCMMFVL